MSVQDTDTAGGFKNLANTGSEYAHNSDGSMTRDDNKGISSITYNMLGKPQVVTFTNGQKVEYVYDASGTKLTVKTWQGATLKSVTNTAGGLVYEGSTPALSYFASPEGRVVKNGANFEYQYAIADHQGNTRVVFTSAPAAPQNYFANMEAATNTNFNNYTSRVNFDLMDNTDPGYDGTDYAQKLYGNSGSQVGVAKSFKVYPGDKVSIRAFAKYYDPETTTSNLSGFASALVSAYGVSPPGSGEAANAWSALNNYGTVVAGGGGHDNSSGSYPKAYVNLLVVDKKYNFLDAAWDQINGGRQVGTTPTAHDEMYQEYVAREEGYVYVFVSNENPTLVEVYFDDVTVTITPGNVIQANEYYPYGLQTTNSWTRSSTLDNNFLYNGGTELNKTTQVYDLYYRNYDPALGRFGQVDPMASKYGPVSPYHFAGNNPVVMNDPLGDDYGDNEYINMWYNTNVMHGPYEARNGSSVYRGMDPSGNNVSARFWAQHVEWLQTNPTDYQKSEQMKLDQRTMSMEEFASKYGEKTFEFDLSIIHLTIGGQNIGGMLMRTSGGATTLIAGTIIEDWKTGGWLEAGERTIYEFGGEEAQNCRNSGETQQGNGSLEFTVSIGLQWQIEVIGLVNLKANFANVELFSNDGDDRRSVNYLSFARGALLWHEENGNEFEVWSNGSEFPPHTPTRTYFAKTNWGVETKHSAYIDGETLKSKSIPIFGYASIVGFELKYKLN